MKVNELRIGNWVEDVNTGIIQFTVGDFEHIAIHSPAIENYKPIPLTDEWLERFGFKKEKHYRKRKNGISSYSWFIRNKEFLSIEKHDCGDLDEGNTFYPTFIYNGGYDGYVLTQVHELQNLYFALKGEELTIQD